MPSPETKSSTPSETGAAVLRAAADDPERRATPPEHLPAAARNAVTASLLRAGMLEELPPVGNGSVAVLRITPAGLIAIGRETVAVTIQEGASPEPERADEAGTTPPARLPLREACTGLLAAWDAGEDRPALPGAVEALRAVLARRRDGGAVRDAAAPRRAREGTKQQVVLALLRRPEGATIADVMGATGSAPHTVRGFLTGLKKRGHAVEVVDRVRQVGPGKAGAKGSYSVYRVSEATTAYAVAEAG